MSINIIYIDNDTDKLKTEFNKGLEGYIWEHNHIKQTYGFMVLLYIKTSLNEMWISVCENR